MPHKSLESGRKACKKHYNENKQYYQDRNKRRKAEFTKIIRDLKDRPCSDCGRSYPHYVMDFDHRNKSEKSFNVGEVNKVYSKESLFKEINKCDVVCANCHRERTF